MEKIPHPTDEFEKQFSRLALAYIAAVQEFRAFQNDPNRNKDNDEYRRLNAESLAAFKAYRDFCLLHGMDFSE